MGWLRVLNKWVGAGGSVTGSDIDDNMLTHAKAFVATESLRNVTLLKDDIFASQLPSDSFDRVHSRFQIAPLGRAAEQVALSRRLTRPADGLSSKTPIWRPGV